MKSSVKFTATGFIVWILCAVYYLYELFLRTVIGTFQPPIMYDLKLTTFKFSLLSSTTYLLIYAAMQIPVGYIVDNLGLKKSVFLGVVLCSIASIGFSFANDYTTAIFFRLLTGVGSAFGFICLLVAVYDWMPRRNLALFMGLSQFIGVMGPMIAAGPLNNMSEVSNIDWRTVFLWSGLFGVILAFSVLYFVKNNNETSGSYMILYRPQPASSGIMTQILRWQPWFIATYSATIYFAVEYLSENEGKSVLISKGFSSNFSAYMITIAWLSYAISCPILGFLSDHFSRRRLIMTGAAIVSLIGIVLLAFSATKISVIVAFMFLGFGAAGQSLGFANIAEQFKARYLPIALGLNNALITIAIAINAPLLGLMIEHTGYDALFFAIIGVAIIALCVVLFGVKETFCKSQADFTYLDLKA